MVWFCFRVRLGRIIQILLLVNIVVLLALVIFHGFFVLVDLVTNSAIVVIVPASISQLLN